MTESTLNSYLFNWLKFVVIYIYMRCWFPNIHWLQDFTRDPYPHAQEKYLIYPKHTASLSQASGTRSMHRTYKIPARRAMDMVHAVWIIVLCLHTWERERLRDTWCDFHFSAWWWYVGVFDVAWENLTILWINIIPRYLARWGLWCTNIDRDSLITNWFVVILLQLWLLKSEFYLESFRGFVNQIVDLNRKS